MKISKFPNVIFGVIIFIISLIIPNSNILGFSIEGNLIIVFTGCIVGVIIASWSKSFFFERITIETKGGKLI